MCLSLFEDILIGFGFMSEFLLLFHNLNIPWSFILEIEGKNLLIEFWWLVYLEALV